MTRLEIITEAVLMAGRSDLLSEGRKWLNLVLERIYKNWDWHWLEKSSTGLALVDGGSIPTDYRAAKNAYVINNGQRVPVTFIDTDEYDYRNQNATAVGMPRYAYHDYESGTFKFWPHPDKSYTWDLRYYKFPTLPTYADNTADGQTPLWPDDANVLIQGVYAKALQYQDDTRFKDEDAKFLSMIKDVRMNNYDMRAGHNRIKLGKNFKRRF